MTLQWQVMPDDHVPWENELYGIPTHPEKCRAVADELAALGYQAQRVSFGPVICRTESGEDEVARDYAGNVLCAFRAIAVVNPHGPPDRYKAVSQQEVTAELMEQWGPMVTRMVANGLKVSFDRLREEARA